MMTWDEVRAHLRREFQLTHDEPEWLGLVWRFADAHDEIAQPLQISVVDSSGERWLCLTTPVASRGEVDPAVALLHNANLLAGSLCFLGPSCVLRHLVPLGALDASTLARAIEMIPHEAARLRRYLLLSPTTRRTIFENFAE
jgi:hypothetical protein